MAPWSESSKLLQSYLLIRRFTSAYAGIVKQDFQKRTPVTWFNGSLVPTLPLVGRFFQLLLGREQALSFCVTKRCEPLHGSALDCSYSLLTRPIACASEKFSGQREGHQKKAGKTTHGKTHSHCGYMYLLHPYS